MGRHYECHLSKCYLCNKPVGYLLWRTKEGNIVYRRVDADTLSDEDRQSLLRYGAVYYRPGEHIQHLDTCQGERP